MKRKENRGISAGTVIALAVTVLTLGITVLMAVRFSSGTKINLSAVTGNLLSLGNDGIPDEIEEIPIQTVAEATTEPEQSHEPAVVSVQPVPTAAPGPALRRGGSFTLTAGGTVALESNTRRSGYSNDSNKYDFTDIMGMIAPYVRADINTVFLENLLDDESKVSNYIVPTCCADMLKTAGFDTVAAGFSRAWDKKADGVGKTLVALRSIGMDTLGLFPAPEEAAPVIRNINGVRVALFQYTATVSDDTRRSMNKTGVTRMIPDASVSEITEDIRMIRESTDVVIVFVQWGKAGTKNPTKAQITMAGQIADAGADIIIGNGSRNVQKMEFLTGHREDGSEHQVFCAYSLGALLSDDRTSTSRIGSCLLNMTVDCDENGNVSFRDATYTPTYIWKYKQDNSYYYRVLVSDAAPPDGMDSDQIKSMNKTLNTVKDALKDSPVTER